MLRKSGICALMTVAGLSLASVASAQMAAGTDRKWSVDFGLGWDKGISGNINSGAIGTLNGFMTVITKNKYEDVYGTGLHLRFGGGYMFRDLTELRVNFTFQSLDADLVAMGDYFTSPLYGQYDDYQSFGMDVGVRRYFVSNVPKVKFYGEGTIGLAFIEELDVELVAPGLGLRQVATDFYDATAAFTLGANAGATFDINPSVGAFVQIGLRYVTGQADVDNLVGTDLAAINDKSSRWAIPFTAGVRFTF